MSGLPRREYPNVLVGLETSDDAGIVRLTPDLALVQTVDFFTPIVDDPFEYGAIAAANSLSDVYAMGGTPVSALNVVGFPTTELDLSILGEILRGGHHTLDQAGIPLLGGHSVKAPELFFGLSVTGHVHPDRYLTNRGARPGDAIVLTKPLGTGILTTALKKNRLSEERLTTVTESMKVLNAEASKHLVRFEAHACTDVTGYGLLGHLLEMIRNSGVDAEIETSSLPLLDGVLEHAEAGDKPGGLKDNRAYVDPYLEVSPACEATRVDVCSDPQTSGGLLITLEAGRAEDLLETLHGSGVVHATRIGSIHEGSGRIRLVP